MEKVLSSFNITMDDINGSSLGISEGLDAMRNGLADALITPGATPVSSVADALSGNSNCRLYSLTEEEKDTLLTDWGFMTQMDIAADTYPGQTETVTAVGHIGFIACNADLPEDVVYDIVMALYNNQADVLAINPQMNGPCFLNPEESINTMAASGVQLHPGAERAMRELGLIK
jgi:TRAP transporter TAXI family solute receptor